jgi:hypothetical protein
VKKIQAKNFLGCAIATLSAVAAFQLLGQAQQPAPPAAGKTPALTSAESTAPAGGSANRDTKKGKAFKQPARPKGPTPRLPDGHVDLTGVWNGGGPVGDVAQGLLPGETIELTAEGKRIMDSRQSKDDPEANCLPTGIPRIAPYPWRILQDPGHIFFLFEGNIHSFRQIFLNQSKHPDDPDPTWYGHSIGKWDGDTMVVDTVGFNDKFWFDFRGHPHSEQLHTIERYTRTDLGTLENETTIIDPATYTKPFKIKFIATLRPNEELMEYICQENQQDAQHLQGKAGLP